MNPPPFGPEELETCLKVLRRLAREPGQCSVPSSQACEVAAEAARLLRSVKGFEKAEGKKRDLDMLESTGIRQQREARNLAARNAQAPESHSHLSSEELKPQALLARLSTERNCYVCKALYREVHHFYDLLCPACGDLNFHKRTQTADLSGHVAVVTGGRIKIGFQIALKLLRAGSRVLITTRFPNDAALRFFRQHDFSEWQNRLSIYAADFRSLLTVRELARAISKDVQQLDLLINNAAQTVRRPPAFYRHLLETESQSRAELPKPAQALLAGPQVPIPSDGERLDALSPLPLPAALSQLPLWPEEAFVRAEDFPIGQFDADGQQRDYRPHNSWVERLGDVSLGELVEVHAVNCLAPYLLIGGLEPLLSKLPLRDRHIINVSAMEGKFHAQKTGFHPHTNMAKAALNMLTRTCADGLARKRIFMNSVDTGWITNEYPFPKTQAMAEEGFQPPLDETDGASRVCDPIFLARNTGQPTFGKFYKDYREVSW
jgi:NAD(P)-dependent dehydrogenase (short-subunit alcohol dehydrogenase family)